MKINPILRNLICGTILATMLLIPETVTAQLRQYATATSGTLYYAIYDHSVKNRVYATNRNFLLVSEDAGTTWRVAWQLPTEYIGKGAITDLKSIGDSDVLFFTITHASEPEIAGLYSLNHKTGVLKHYVTPNHDKIPTAKSYDVDPSDFNKVVIYTSYMDIATYDYCSEVYYTDDGGATWSLIYNFRNHNSVHPAEVAFSPENSQKIYLSRALGPSGATGGIFISDDAGKNWTESLAGIPLGPIAINPQNHDEIIVGGGDGSETECLYCSSDGGKTWTPYNDIEWRDYLMDNIVAITYNPQDPNRIYVLEGNQIITTGDGFETWQEITPERYFYGFHASINPFNTQEILTAASIDFYDKMMYTPDGYRTFEEMPGARFSEKSDGIAADNGYLYYLLDGVCRRQEVSTEEETEVAAAGYSRLFSGKDYNGVVLLSNPEAKQLAFVDFNSDPQLTAIEGTVENVTAVAPDRANAGVYYIVADGTLAVADITTKTITPLASFPVGNISAIAGNAGYLFIAANGKVYRSADNGATWNEKSAGLGGAGILALAADGNTIVATTGSGWVYLSDDLAENWTRIAFSDNNIRSIAVSQGTIATASFAAGQPLSIHFSTDNGATWSTISSKELHYAHATAVDFDFTADAITAHIASSDMGRLSYFIMLQPDGTIAQFPYEESFEKGGIPRSWQQTATGNEGWTACAKSQGSPDSAPGGSETKIRFAGAMAEGKARLVTPELDLSSLEYPTLKFSYAVTAGLLRLYYQSTVDGAWAELAFNVHPESGWQVATIALPDKSAAYRVAFEAESTGNSDIQIDDISIYNGNPQSFNDIRNLSASIVYGPEAVLSWTAPEGNYHAIYNVYRDNEKIAENITANSHKDSGFSVGEHSWTVKTVYDGAESQGTGITVTYTGEHTPVGNFTATASNDVNGNAVASLVWSVPDGYSAGIYNVYRDDEKIAEKITGTSFTDTDIPNGIRTWNVTAVYGETESVRMSAEAEVTNRCAPVRNLRAGYNVASEKVLLTWEEPCDLPADYLSHAAAPAQALNYQREGEWRMKTAVRWSPDELRAMGLDGAKITEIAIVPYEEKAKYYPRLWIGGDGKNAGKEETLYVTNDGYNMNLREWNSMPLNSPIIIDASQELWIGCETVFTGPSGVIGCDAGPEKKGVNKIFDGSTWYDASEFDPSYNANFCIAARIEAADGKKTIKRIDTPKGISYNVYRNDEFLVNTTETSYEESGLLEDYYTYVVTAVHGVKGESAARSAELFAGNLCPKAENVEANADQATSDVLLTWDAVDPYYVEEIVLSESFDNGIPETWTLLDKDGDGACWASSDEPSKSYNGYPNPLKGKSVFSDTKVYTFDPATLSTTFTVCDNWLVSPEITLTHENAVLRYSISQLYWASWATYYEVLVSTTGTDYDDFSVIFSETLGQGGDMLNVLWHSREIDLSEYAGRSLRIALRHKCVEEEKPSEGLQLDELSVVETVPVERKYEIYRDGKLIAGGVAGVSYTDTKCDNGEHEYCVVTVCEDLGYNSKPSCITTSVSDVVRPASVTVTVFPNPTSGVVQIENAGRAIGVVTIADMSGRTVCQYDFSDSGKALIDISDLENGIYFLRIKGHDVKVIKK